MGDLRRAIDFDDVSLKVESFSKMYQDIIGNLTKFNVESINEKNVHNISSVNGLLTDCIRSSDGQTVEYSCRVLMKLVQENRMDIDFAMNFFVNIASIATEGSSASCSSPLVASICRLILLQTKQRASSPKSLATNPLFILYRRKRKLLWTILRKIEDYFLNSSETDNELFGETGPFLASLLISPKSSCEELLLTCDFLLHIKKPSKMSDVLLSSVLLWMNLQVDFVLTKFLRSTQFDCLGSKFYLLAVETTSVFDEELLSNGRQFAQDPLIYLFFVCRLHRFPVSLWNSAIFYVEHFLSNCKCPILAAVSLPSILTMYSSLQHSKKFANDAFEEECSKRLRICINLVGKCVADRDTSHIHETTSQEFHFSRRCAELEFLFFFCSKKRTSSVGGDFWNQNANWVDEFSISFLCAVAFVEKEFRRDVLKIFADLVVKKPNLALYLFYFLLHQFSKEPSYEPLRIVSHFVTNQVCLTTVSRFVFGLTRSEAYENFAFQVLGDLYRKQPIALYEQVKLLVFDVISTKGKSLALEKTKLIRLICEISDEDCGVEMLQLLERIVNEKKGDEDAEMVSVAVDAISHLCWNEVLDINVAWDMLYGKIYKDERKIVLISLIKFCEMISKIYVECEEDVKKTVLISSLSFLWNIVVAKSSDTNVVSSALEALTTFDPVLFTKDVLPKELHSDEIESDESREDVREKYFGIFANLMGIVIPACFICLAKLFGKFLQSEVESMGRRIFTLASLKRQSTAKSRLNDAVSNMCLKFSDSSVDTEFRSSLAVPILLAYELNIDASLASVEMTSKSVIKRGRQYVDLMKRLLVQTPIDVRNLERSLSYPSAWFRFMPVVFAACVEARRAELESSHGVKNFNEQQKRKNSAWINVRDQIVELIKNAFAQNDIGRVNGMMALVGLAVGVKDFCLTNNIDVGYQEMGEYAKSNLSQKRFFDLIVDTLLNVLYVGETTGMECGTTSLFSAQENISSVVTSYARLALCSFLPQAREELSCRFYGLSKILTNSVTDLLDRDAAGDRSLSDVDTLFVPICLTKMLKTDVDFVSEVLFKSNATGRFLGISFTVIESKFESTTIVLKILHRMVDSLDGDDRIELWYAAAKLVVWLLCRSNGDEQREVKKCAERLLKRFDSRATSQRLLLAQIVGVERNETNKQQLDEYLMEVKDEMTTLERKEEIFKALGVALESYLCDCPLNDLVPRRIDGEFRKNACDVLVESIENAVRSGVPMQDLFLTVAKLGYVSNSLINEKDTHLPVDYSYLEKNSLCRVLVERLNETKQTEVVQCVLNSFCNIDNKMLPFVDWFGLFWKHFERKDVLDDVAFVSLAVAQKSTTILVQLTRKSNFVRLRKEARIVLAVNVGQLVTLAPNKCQMLRTLSEDAEIAKQFYENFGILGDFDRNTRSACIEFLTFKVLSTKIENYAKFCVDDFFMSTKCVDNLTNVDEFEFGRLVNERLSSFSKFAVFALQFAQTFSDLTILIKLVEIYQNTFDDEEKQNALMIFAHVVCFGRSRFTVEAEKDLFINFLNMTVSALTVFDLLKFDACFDLFSAFVSGTSNVAPPLPYFVTVSNENGKSVDFAGFIALRLPFAIFDRLSVNLEAVTKKFIDWCFRVLMFQTDKQKDVSGHRPTILNCLRMFREDENFKEIISNNEDFICTLF